MGANPAEEPDDGEGTDSGTDGDVAWGDLPNPLASLKGVADELVIIANKFGTSPIQTVKEIVATTLLNPIFGSIYRFGITLITLIGVVFLGGDLALGWSGEPPNINLPWPANTLVTGDGGGYIGLADLPVWASSTVIGMLEPLANAVLYPIRAFNVSVSTAAANAGIAGPVVVFGLQILEIAAGLYVLSIIVEVVVGYAVPGLSGRIGAAFRKPLEVFK